MAKVDRLQRLLWLLAVIVFLPGLILVGCGSSDSKSTPVPPATIPSSSPVVENPPVLLDDSSSEVSVPTPELTPDTDTIENSGTAQTDRPFPHLEIQGVTAEPIPWFEVTKKGGCDFFRIKLKFEIVNIGTANFPPENNVRAELYWRILYNEERDESDYTNIYDNIRIRHPADFNVPAGGTAIVEREFRAARGLPLNPFQVVAWFVGDVPEYNEHELREQLNQIPAADTPAHQWTKLDGITLKLEGGPFVSDPFEFPGPDIKPVSAFYIPNVEHSNYYDVGLIFENVSDVTTAGSVQVSLSVPDKTGPNNAMSIRVSGEINGPFQNGKHAVIFCDRLASGIPDFSKGVFSATLKCSESTNMTDVDPTNDTKELTTVNEQPDANLSALLAGCVSHHFPVGDCSE